MRVRVNCRYVYRPALFDIADPPYGVRHGLIDEGSIVTVVNLRGCPPANTMNHCHIHTMDGQFAGLVQTSSLVPVRQVEKELGIRLKGKHYVCQS